MGILNPNAVADARTQYEALAVTALANARATGIWNRLARRVNATGIAHQTIIGGATPTWRQWTDEKDFGGFRKYARTTPLKKYHKSIELQRTDVVYDTEGSTAAVLEGFVGKDIEAVFDKLVLDSLSGNPTCVDGVALIHDSHPHGSSTTWDNKTTTALSFSAFDTEVERMMALLDEHGEPLNLNPRLLVCHTDLRHTAREIIGSELRPVSVGTAGAMNSGGIGGSAIANMYTGDGWDLIVTPRLTTGQWVIVDPRFPPLKLCVWREPEIIVVDDMTGESRVRRDVFLYGAEADMAADGEQPWGIAGKL